MHSKLEEKLMQYEKNIPVTDKQELLNAVEVILKEEESKKPDKQDIDLIDEAVDIILTLKGIDSEELENEADVLTDRILNEAHDKVASGAVKPRKPRLKWLIPVAAVLSVIISVNVVAYAMGYDLLSMTSAAYKRLKEMIWYSNDDNSIIITDDNRVYKDVEEMIEKESFENLLWPSQTDEIKSDGNIEVNNYDSELVIFCRFNMAGNSIEYSVTMPSRYPMTDLDLMKIGKYDVALYDYDNKHQADMIYKGNGYTITVQNKEDLEYFIKNMEEINR